MISGSARTSWLLDETRDPYRVLLIEISHSEGTVYIASEPYVSNEWQTYDDAIVTLPEIDTDLETFGGFGSFTVKNEDDDSKWFDYLWYGYKCNMFYGDLGWKREDFYQIGSTFVDQCLSLGDDIYRFELFDAGLILDKFLVTEDTTRTETVAELCNWIALSTGITVSFLNIPVTKQALDLEVELSTLTTAGTLLREVARDINAELRTDLVGNVEIFSAEDEVTELAIDDISAQTLEAVEVIKPFSRIEATMNDGSVHTIDTGAKIGRLENVYKINTNLRYQADVEVMLQEQAAKFAKQRNVFEVPVSVLGDPLIVGNQVFINHPDVLRTGSITRIRKEPLSAASTLEVKV